MGMPNRRPDTAVALADMVAKLPEAEGLALLRAVAEEPRCPATVRVAARRMLKDAGADQRPVVQQRSMRDVLATLADLDPVEILRRVAPNTGRGR